MKPDKQPFEDGKVIGLPEQFSVARIGKWKEGQEKGIVITDKTLHAVSEAGDSSLNVADQPVVGRSRTDAAETDTGTDVSNLEPQSQREQGVRGSVSFRFAGKPQDWTIFRRKIRFGSASL